MTTGSWSTLTERVVATACSSNSKVRNGTQVSWVGGDSPVLAHSGRTFKERKAQFLKNPSILPNGRLRLPVDPVATASKGLSKTIFDTAREKRLRIYDSDSGNPEYGSPNPYTKFWRSFRETEFPWYYGNGTYAGTGTISECGFGPDQEIGNPFTADHDYKLISRLRSKVVGSEFNLGSFLGAEGLDTLRFFTDTANRIYRSMIAARRLNFREAHRVLSEWGRYRYSPSLAGRQRRVQEDVYRDLLEAATGKNRGQAYWSTPASSWLEWHLAVEPLLGDCVAAAEQLAHITQMPRTMRISASVTTKADYPQAFTGSQWVGKRVVRKSIIAYFTHTPEPSSFLGLQDPEVTIWNALPLSFVSDYFYNIGGFLEARAAAKAFPLGLYVSTVKDETRLTECLGRKYDGNFNMVIPSPDAQAQGFVDGSLRRTVSASLDVPTPDVRPLGALASWTRAATVASLIATFTDRNAKRFTR